MHRSRFVGRRWLRTMRLLEGKEDRGLALLTGACVTQAQQPEAAAAASNMNQSPSPALLQAAEEVDELEALMLRPALANQTPGAAWLPAGESTHPDGALSPAPLAARLDMPSIPPSFSEGLLGTDGESMPDLLRSGAAVDKLGESAARALPYELLPSIVDDWLELLLDDDRYSTLQQCWQDLQATKIAQPVRAEAEDLPGVATVRTIYDANPTVLKTLPAPMRHAAGYFGSLAAASAAMGHTVSVPAQALAAAAQTTGGRLSMLQAGPTEAQWEKLQLEHDAAAVGMLQPPDMSDMRRIVEYQRQLLEHPSPLAQTAVSAPPACRRQPCPRDTPRQPGTYTRQHGYHTTTPTLRSAVAAAGAHLPGMHPRRRTIADAANPGKSTHVKAWDGKPASDAQQYRAAVSAKIATLDRDAQARRALREQRHPPRQPANELRAQVHHRDLPGQSSTRQGGLRISTRGAAVGYRAVAGAGGAWGAEDSVFELEPGLGHHHARGRNAAYVGEWAAPRVRRAAPGPWLSDRKVLQKRPE